MKYLVLDSQVRDIQGRDTQGFLKAILQSTSLFKESEVIQRNSMSVMHFVLLQLTTRVRKTFINNWMLKDGAVVDTNG